MQDNTTFFNDYIFTAYVSLLLKREGFTRWKVGRRTMQDHELVLITKGKGHIYINDQKLPLSEGTIIYLYRNLAHSIVADKKFPITFETVHFSYVKVQHPPESWVYHQDVNYYKKEQHKTKNLWSFDTEYEKLPFNHTLQLKHYNTVKDIFYKMGYIFAHKNIGYELQLNSLLLELIFIVYKETITPQHNDSKIKKLHLATDYIEEHFKDNISLKQLAELCNVSESYLNKLFKSNTGKTPINYINHVRVNHAVDYLMNTEMSIKEIAYQLGFCDEFYFSKTFKKIRDLSPREFRNQA